MYDFSGRIVKRVQDTIILGVRQALVGHPKYNYQETTSGEYDYDNSQVWISDVAPLEAVAYPYIVIDALSSADDERYLGPDDLEDQIYVDPVTGLTIAQSINFTGFPLTVKIKVYSRDTITRDDLMGAVYDSMKITKDILAVNGVELVHSRFLPQSREYLNNRWWFVSTLDIDVYAEWSTSTPITQTVTGLDFNLSTTGVTETYSSIEFL